MKILWVKTDFLHPTNRGGQIRSLEMLRRLHAQHEVHYVAYDSPEHPEGMGRAPEYSARAFAVDRPIPPRGSLRFWQQLARNAFSPLPLAVGRYESDAMKRQIATLTRTGNYDAVVCDFLSSAPNLPDLKRSVIFQHNVETMIWRRHAEHAANPLKRAYFRAQAERMFRCERDYCREAAYVIAVSRPDADAMRQMFGVTRVSEVPTGVDTAYFAPQPVEPAGDIVFSGAQDWMPNIDGIRWFAAEVLPQIRRAVPGCTLTIAGRSPAPEVRALARSGEIQVTGTVPDIRPYLWGSKISIVPLRIGGGTRLKIYEAMAAGVPVVSTTIGAEGLDVSDGADIALADTPSVFAERCIRLLQNRNEHQAMREAARELVTTRFSWERVTQRFTGILEGAACAA